MERFPRTVEGRRVGIQATWVKADTCLELILANSEMPPLPGRESGEMEATRQRISSLQKFCSPWSLGADAML